MAWAISVQTALPLGGLFITSLSLLFLDLHRWQCRQGLSPTCHAKAWWIRRPQIFKILDHTKMFQILLYILSTNFIKLGWPSISSNLSIVDWFKYLHYFCFLKDSFSKIFCQNLYLNLFVLIASFSYFFSKTTFLIDFNLFSHAGIFWASGLNVFYYNNNKKRNQKKVINERNIAFCFTHSSVL